MGSKSNPRRRRAGPRQGGGGAGLGHSPARGAAERLGLRVSQEHYYDASLSAHVWQLTAVCRDGRVLGAAVAVSEQELVAARHPAALVQSRVDAGWEQIVQRAERDE